MHHYDYDQMNGAVLSRLETFREQARQDRLADLTRQEYNQAGPGLRLRRINQLEILQAVRHGDLTVDDALRRLSCLEGSL